MEEFRTRGFIAWSKIDLFLRTFRSIWISTARPDGRPHAVPAWHIWDAKSKGFVCDLKYVLIANTLQENFNKVEIESTT